MSFARPDTRVAVIGCGYVGSALAEALLRDGHDVVGTTTTRERVDELEARGIKPALLDVADVTRLHSLLRDRDAAYLTVAPGRRGERYREVYLCGAKNLVVAAGGTPVRRIIYTSSARVYGRDDGSWVDEASPADPKDDNGRILLEAERTLLEGRHQGERGIHATVVRLGGIHGPGRDLATRIRSRAGTERSDGDVYVNLIHRDDIVTALSALIDLRHHGILNLTDDQPELRCTLYDRVVTEAGLPPIRWLQGETPGKRGKRVRNDLIKKTLGLVLQHPTQ